MLIRLRITRCRLAVAGLLLATHCLSLPPEAKDIGSATQRNLVLKWSGAALQGVRDAKMMGAPMAARALAIVHTCMYDAWAAYDERAAGMQLRGALRRPVNEHTQANKERAISYAAYRALADVLPVDTESVYKPLMRQFGYDPSDNSTDIETPTGIGNVACGAVLEFRHHDKSNQLGDLAQGAYGDWSGYSPVNAPAMIPARLPAANPDYWQPLVYGDASMALVSAKNIFTSSTQALPLGTQNAPTTRFVPVTAISTLLRGKKIRAWGGPGKGAIEMDGSEWLPYQLATFPTPPFPEYVSGKSTYSATAARILELWTGSDHFGYSVTLPAGSSKIEPGVTAGEPVVLKWNTFTDAANEAGMSRRYGGIHFALADTMGRKLGRLVADSAWAKAQTYFDGANTSPLPDLTAAK